MTNWFLYDKLKFTRATFPTEDIPGLDCAFDNFLLSDVPRYEQLKDVLQKQIEHKLLSVENHTMITFIGYFDIYMTKSNLEHEVIKNYINVYAPILKENLLESIKQALIKGVKDNTLIIEMFEVDCYVGYIYHSLMSLMSRIAVKRYEIDIQQYDFIQKHINVLLHHLKK